MTSNAPTQWDDLITKSIEVGIIFTYVYFVVGYMRRYLSHFFDRVLIRYKL